MSALTSFHASGLVPLRACVHRARKSANATPARLAVKASKKNDVHPVHGDAAKDAAAAAAATAAFVTLTATFAADAATSPRMAREAAKQSGLFHVPGGFPPLVPKMDKIDLSLVDGKTAEAALKAHVDGINETVAVSQAAVDNAAKGLDAAAASAAGQYPALAGMTDTAIKFDNEIVYGAAAIVLLFVWDGIDRLISKPTKTPSTDGSMTYSFKAQEQATAKAKYIAETEMQAALKKMPLQESSGELASNAVAINRKQETKKSYSTPSFFKFDGLRSRK